MSGIKESDTGLAHPSRWDLVSDKQAQQEEHPLQVRAGAAGVGGAAMWVLGRRSLSCRQWRCCSRVLRAPPPFPRR